MYHTKLFALFVLLSLSMCNAASFYPSSLQTQKGSASSQPISVLQTKDQSGSQDTWNNYIEFDGTAVAYKGVFTFDVSSLTSSVAAYTLNVNFKGPKKSAQVWQFEYSQPAEQTWALVGDNTAATSWKWSSLALVGTLPFSTLVSNGQVQVRLSAKTATDNCDIDFLELVVVAVDPSVTVAPSTVAPSTVAPSTVAPSTVAPSTVAPSTVAPSTVAPSTVAPSTVAPSTVAPATSAPTNTPKPTTKPTPAATSAPTSPPSTGNGRKCAAGTHYVPGPGTTWQWQLTGTINTNVDVQVYDIDMFGSSQALIDQLHAAGRAVVCYIDTAYEPGRPDSSQFTAAVLGKGIDGWPGQKWVDIRSTVVRNIMTSRLAMAAAKKCDAVEMDDVDSYQNNPGFPITAADQLNFNTFLATTAHSYDLGIALKNDVDQIASLAPVFDFAINEQCFQYDECSAYSSSFIAQGKAVFGVEYELATSKFCSTANSNKFSWLKKNLDLDASLTQCCTSSCSGTFTCKANPSSRSLADPEELALIDEALVFLGEEEIAKSQ